MATSLGGCMFISSASGWGRSMHPNKNVLELKAGP